MEPRIQYAKTEDGVNIAYWSLGEGFPVVNLPGAPSSHIGMEWNDPDFGAWYRRHTLTHRVVRFDPRGTGLSDRNTTDLSLEARMRDLEAVVDSLGLDRFPGP